MNRFFKPYEGTRPFLFISYAHHQSEEVVSTIRILHEKGWRLWYDEGIPAGSDWPANIAQHMSHFLPLRARYGIAQLLQRDADGFPHEKARFGGPSRGR